MIGKNELSEALDGAIRAAFMLTGSTQAAEHAVLNGIAANECYRAGDDAFLLETIKAAIQRRPDDGIGPDGGFGLAERACEASPLFAGESERRLVEGS